MKDPDLSHYRNLAEFFYRELRDDARPIADAPLVNRYNVQTEMR
jgi:phosphatidylserine decarboxylase